MDKLTDVVVNQNANIQGLFQLESLAREKRVRQKTRYSKTGIIIFYHRFFLEDWVLRLLFILVSDTQSVSMVAHEKL